jgi:hypothetical protein
MASRKRARAAAARRRCLFDRRRPAEPDAKVDPDLDTGESDDSKEVSDSSTDSDSVDEKQALLNDEDDKQEAMQ